MVGIGTVTSPGDGGILTKNTPPSTFRARLPVTLAERQSFQNKGAHLNVCDCACLWCGATLLGDRPAGSSVCVYE